MFNRLSKKKDKLFSGGGALIKPAFIAGLIVFERNFSLEKSA
jgi:hypothetical protein